MPLTNSDILRAHCVAVTGSPAPGWYDTAQNDPAASGVSSSGTMMPSTTIWTEDTDQNLLKVLDLSDLSASTYYGAIALLNSSAGSPGAIDLSTARVWFTQVPSQAGITCSAAAVLSTGQTAGVASTTSTTAPSGISFTLCSAADSWANGIKIGSGSPVSDGTLSAAKANCIYLYIKAVFSGVSAQLVKASANNALGFKLSGGESS